MPVRDLKQSPTMMHLIEALDDGKDIGHYGRLTVAIVAQHFMDEDAVYKLLRKGKGVDDDELRALAHQVVERGYNPPRRERLLEWHGKQDFPLLANPDDPDAGNLYRELDFPEEVFERIEEYQEQRAEATTKR